MASHTFIVNGEQVTVDAPDDVRLLWVLRDLLHITGPKYGCGLGVCQSCTSHINGHAFNPCCVPVGELRPDDQITTIEGLAATVGAELHPVQQAWLDHDVAQCGYCQPGQIMAATALIEEVLDAGRTVTDADLDELRNVCRCGTYPRIHAAIMSASVVMAAQRARPTRLVETLAATPRAVPAEGMLPATGTSVPLGAAAAAAGAAVAIRAVTRKATPADE